MDGLRKVRIRLDKSERIKKIVALLMLFPPGIEQSILLMVESILPSRPESVEEDILRRILRPNYSVLEIGAMVGGSTRLISSLVGVRGSVLSLEPNPFCIPILLRRTHGLRNVRVINVAAGDEAGWATLHTNRVKDAASTLVSGILFTMRLSGW